MPPGVPWGSTQGRRWWGEDGNPRQAEGNSQELVNWRSASRNIQHGEEEVGRCPDKFQVGDREGTQLAPRREKSFMPTAGKKDAKRTSGPDRSPGQCGETSDSSDLTTGAKSRVEDRPWQQMSVHGSRAGKTNGIITSRLSKDRDQGPKTRGRPRTKPKRCFLIARLFHLCFSISWSHVYRILISLISTISAFSFPMPDLVYLDSLLLDSSCQRL